MKDLKVVFMGTPEFAVPVLNKLIDFCNVLLVVTQPDKEVGRDRNVLFSPIKKVALDNNISVFQPVKIKNEYEHIISYQPDIIITCAYGQIIPKELLNYPKYGCINVHASLLPFLRGGAPIHHAIIDGYKKTGITIMYMDEHMDSGDIISQEDCLIEDNDNVLTLHDKLSKMGALLLIETLPDIVYGNVRRIKQNEEDVTYAYTITREDEHISFNDSSLAIYNKIRGLYPWPCGYAIINNQEVKILEASISDKDSNFSAGTICEITKDKIGVCTKDKVIYITKVKPNGKKEMLAKDYINGIKKEVLINSIVE